jgi:hypothetical protein
LGERRKGGTELAFANEQHLSQSCSLAANLGQQVTSPLKLGRQDAQGQQHDQPPWRRCKNQSHAYQEQSESEERPRYAFSNFKRFGHTRRRSP